MDVMQGFRGALLVGAAVLPCALGGGRALAQGPAGSGPSREMVTALPASGPHHSITKQAALFDRFVETWDTKYSTIAPDGTVSRSEGRVLFGWIIDGRAMQDIWIADPPPGSGEERSIGTTIRFYDAKADIWRVVFVAPGDGGVVQLTGGRIGDRIVLRGEGRNGALVRWSFNDLRDDSFVWRGEVSHDSGETWRLREENLMSRARKPAAER